MEEKFFTQSLVISNEKIAPEIFSLKLRAPEVAQIARAGQFAMIYLNRGEMLLPRPISFCDADGDALELVFHVVGAGTAALSQTQTGAQIKILAPLGNGFSVEKNSRRVAIVGGGIGTPPLFFLAKTLAARGIEFDIFLGFRDTPILIEKFKKILHETSSLHEGNNLHETNLSRGNIFIATENGSVGHHGRVTDILESRGVYDEIFSCGPVPMLRAIADFARKTNTPCKVSVEERMACGLGTCVGCVVKIAGEYVRICREGPVFDAEKIF
ncbi:MAG: dihydroorotate dehydrogenase electron transfer subunit [Defluviitaleaceae bacterium]|nr:dihydroorotate dehydrogenase electron transfer subunit [Defluviitaleaceae bacterium]